MPVLTYVWPIFWSFPPHEYGEGGRNCSLLGWRLYDLLKSMDSEQPSSMQGYLPLRDEIVQVVLPHIEKPSLLRSLLLFKLAKLNGKGTFFHVIRAGLDDFRPEDYEPGISPNSPKPFFSQVESLAGNLHQCLKPAIQDASIRPLPGTRGFADMQRYHGWLRMLQTRFPKNAFLIYYQADTEIVLGQSENALRTFEALARKIPRQAWAWTKLAMAYPPGGEARRDAMLKALSLYRRDDPYAVRLLSDLAREFPPRDPAAKHFLIMSCTLRTSQKWPIPSADQLLLHVWDELESAPLPEAESRAAAACAERRVGLQPAKEAPKQSFVGMLRIPRGRDFGFVGEIHVPAVVIRTIQLCHGDRVAGTAEEKIDTKKNRPGWIAVRIHKASEKKNNDFSGNHAKDELLLHKPPSRGMSGNGA